MLKKLTCLFILSFFSLANAQSYTIKLAVYKDLNLLNKEIHKLSSKLQKDIKINKIGGLYKAQVHPQPNKKSLQSLLPLYKKVFTDAFISPVKPAKTTTSASPANTFYAKLRNHTLYLCSEGKDKKQVLVAVTFNNNTVNYKPLIGNMPPISALYTIKNNKLFLYQKSLLDTQVYSLLEKTFSNYYLISSWVGDKKINRLRYYFTLKDAQEYMHSF